MAKLYEEYRNKDFTILAVNAWDEDDKTVRRFANDHGVKYPLLLEGSTTTADWGVRSLPTNFLINPNGKIVARYGNISDATLETVRGRIRQLVR